MLDLIIGRVSGLAKPPKGLKPSFRIDGPRQMCIEIPPKFPVASIIGFLEGKSAIAIARQFVGKQRNFTGEHFWARGYAMSTVGLELEQVSTYIREQESNDDGGRFQDCRNPMTPLRVTISV